jgi:ABC-2 type transport system permease protein
MRLPTAAAARAVFVILVVLAAGTAAAATNCVDSTPSRAPDTPAHAPVGAPFLRDVSLPAFPPKSSVQALQSGPAENVGTGRAMSAPNATYPVTFSEQGLPPGMEWFLNVSGGPSANATSKNLTLGLENGTYLYAIPTTELYPTLPNGTFFFTITSGDFHYTPISQPANFTVAGNALFEPVVFAYTYPVTFVEQGLPPGVQLTVSLNGTLSTYGDLGAQFRELNGSYAYSVNPVLDFGPSPSNGTVLVQGGPRIILITFQPVYALVFSESVLPPGTNWSVSLTGSAGSVILVAPTPTASFALTQFSDGTSLVTFYVSDGRYSYTAMASGHSTLTGTRSVDGSKPPSPLALWAGASPSLGLTALEGEVLGVLAVALALGVGTLAWRRRRTSLESPTGSSSAGPSATRGRVRGAPSRTTQWLVVARSQIRHYLRTYRFVGLLAFVAVVSCLWLVLLVASGRGLAQLSFLDSVSEFTADYAATVPLWVILAAGFFGGDALSVDFHSPTGFFTLVLPVERGILLAGRYASALTLTLAVAFGYALFGILGASFIFGPGAIPWGREATSVALIILFALAAVSVAFCFSSVFRSPAAGVLLTVMVLFVAMSTVDGVVQIAGVQPWWSLNWAGGAVGNVLDWQFVAHQAIPVGGGKFIQSWSATATEGAEIMAAYFFAFFGLSLALYRRKESRG